MAFEPDPSDAPSDEPEPPTAGAEPGGLVQKPGGPLSGSLGLFVSIVLLIGAGYLAYTTFYQAKPVKPEPVERLYLCQETHKTFIYKRGQDEKLPVMSPYSHKRTGYPCERCFYGKDGKVKDKPTYVILNTYVGKTGETHCPECGRLVVGHNPDPHVGPGPEGE